jgi:hypothetical protein
LKFKGAVTVATLAFIEHLKGRSLVKQTKLRSSNLLAVCSSPFVHKFRHSCQPSRKKHKKEKENVKGQSAVDSQKMEAEEKRVLE